LTEDIGHRSPSQLNEYERCPHAYFLARRERVWKRPAPWLAHGTAFHSAVEAFEKSDRVMTPEEVKQHFSDAYRAQINQELKDNPNLSFWESSGRYRALQDIPRRHEVGLEQIDGFFKYIREHPEHVPWTDPAGVQWIEKEFRVKFGSVEVVGYIDVVIEGKPDDYKTGSTPGGDEQLATYAGVLNLEWGIPFTTGRYWMAKQGKPTKPYDLTGWSIERLADVYGSLDDNIKAERFDPTPSPDLCRRCPVRDSCAFKEV
jgi:putative RecB family exonuclease